MERVLFCNIAFMQYYDAEFATETPCHGGKYVSDTGDALEKYNFHVCADGKIRGFVETKYRDGYKNAQHPNDLHIENIDGTYRAADSIDGVTVIFCAYSDRLAKGVLVGWYRNATVYRTRQTYQGRQFNLECDACDAYLIDDEKRDYIIPPVKPEGFAYIQPHIWYQKGRMVPFVQKILGYIDFTHESMFASR